MDLRELLRKVEAAPNGTAELDSEFASVLNDPKWGRRFDDGFHRDRRGGTLPLAILAVFLEAKITLAESLR